VRTHQFAVTAIPFRRVVYEAGPPGYGFARACAEAGISCVVAASSRIRSAADRLARLLRLGEISPVRASSESFFRAHFERGGLR
jgi:hypothetical protein